MNNTEKRLRNTGWLSARWVNIHIDVLNTRTVVVRVTDKEGNTDPESTDTVVEKVIESLDTEKTKWGGFKAAGGHWYLEKNYDPRPLAVALADHTGDWANV